MQTGLYADTFYFGEHTRYWYARTVSCNSMLIIDPDEFSWNESRKISGQGRDGFYPEYGGQRLVRGSCNAFTFGKYIIYCCIRIRKQQDNDLKQRRCPVL